ncbi:zinc ribbon domain-containing protein [Clostridium luticellarii]|jgi:predicted  nucleic acid-binding Zn-ribbon protein|uniref:Putative zinc ribbon domain protein n=1 Tax=Clostridium luticellarii TaxID=1691940 RepID=A0A2T0BAR4_9CLOT|nr:C4-type zinc ribbon domain-containing protein [Clostridium luticellarii]MCI1944089.1 C4-type zinc ribbon domain-containing protein [Clostridium luticellarii]MCI1967269.1 C4-type zinc ribbon domain-containing protein [Clostridium luticellarii]MCI1995181.1 C4-type zinc ribbon domain-containing protein [Clostridium luticellarii]MCI2039323.1 C4-type zinc ribbon domain-containing protein [Clostridium luticellarii]PRR80980.1 putative zinc ribbon domain protein [Clostridium luticellarii]
MLNLLLEIQKNREIIKKTKKTLKEESNNSFMKKIKREFEEEKLKYKALDSKLNATRENMGQLEKKLEHMKEEVKQEESKLYGNLKYDLKFISTLEKSVKLKKDEVKNLEEINLNMMYEEESLVQEKDVSRKKLIHMKNEFCNNKKTIGEKALKAEEDIKKAEKNILSLERKLPPELLDKFNELCAVKGTGAARLSEGVCQGCRMKVSAITIDDIKKNKDIVYCDNCGRIIYYRDNNE